MPTEYVPGPGPGLGYYRETGTLNEIERRYSQAQIDTQFPDHPGTVRYRKSTPGEAWIQGFAIGGPSPNGVTAGQLVWLTPVFFASLDLGAHMEVVP